MSNLKRAGIGAIAGAVIAVVLTLVVAAHGLAAPEPMSLKTTFLLALALIVIFAFVGTIVGPFVGMTNDLQENAARAD
jgi:hypothetical protein